MLAQLVVAQCQPITPNVCEISRVLDFLSLKSQHTWTDLMDILKLC